MEAGRANAGQRFGNRKKLDQNWLGQLSVSEVSIWSWGMRRKNMNAVVNGDAQTTKIVSVYGNEKENLIN